MNVERLAPHYLGLPSLLLMAAVSGALLFVAFPPLDLGPLAWIALAPLFLALSQTRTLTQGALCGLVFGAVFFGGFLYYFTMWGLLPWIAGALLEALFFALFGLLAGPVMRRESPGLRVLGGAGAWALVAYLRANAGPIAYNGGDLAFTQHDQLPMLQLASLFGQGGLTFAIALVNAALSQALLGALPPRLHRPGEDAKLWSRRSAGIAVTCYALLFVAYFWGASVLKTQPAESGRSLQVAIVQGNVPLSTPVTDADVEASKLSYLRLNEAVPDDTDLTIWPESALPGYMPIYPGLEEAGREAAQENEGHLLLGTVEVRGGEYYNTARLYNSSGEVVDRYDKMDLVIYGEYVPFREQLPFLANYPIRAHDLSPGEGRKMFTIERVRVSPLICFEAMFSRPTREVCRLGAEVVAISTSDAWAQNSFEVQQHSCTASIRAVESRRYVCRAASTGQSAIYSPHGEIIASIPVNMPGVLAETAYAREGLSVYHRIGDLPVAALCLLCYCLAWLPMRREGPKKGEGPNPAAAGSGPGPDASHSAPPSQRKG